MILSHLGQNFIADWLFYPYCIPDRMKNLCFSAFKNEEFGHVFDLLTTANFCFR